MSDNSPYFEPESRLQLVDKINHLIRFSDFLLLLTGESGVGKSRLLLQLVPAEADSSVSCCRLQVTPGLSTDDLLRQLLNQLVSHTQVQSGPQARLSALNDHIGVLRTQGQRLLLLVDDADRLSDDALSLLINLQLSNDNDDGTAPQLLLFGHPALIGKLQALGWLDTLAGRVHQLPLEPFSDEEMAEFLRICYPEKGTLPEKDIAALISAAKGFPGRIDGNGRAAPVLAEIPEPEKKAPEKEGKGRRAFPLPPLHMAGIALVLAAVTLGAAWTFAPKDETPDATVDTGSRVSVPLNLTAEKPSDVSGVSQLQSELDKRLAAQEAKSRQNPQVSENASQEDEKQSVELESPDASQKRISLPLNLAGTSSSVSDVQKEVSPEKQSASQGTPGASGTPAASEPEKEPVVVSDSAETAKDAAEEPSQAKVVLSAEELAKAAEQTVEKTTDAEPVAEVPLQVSELPPFVSEKTRPEVVAAQSKREGDVLSEDVGSVPISDLDADSQIAEQKTEASKRQPTTSPSKSVANAKAKGADKNGETPPVVAVVERKPAVKPVTKPESAVKKSVAVETSPRIEADETSLLQSPSSSYALQVLGARAVGSVDRFMRGHKGVEGLRAFATIFKGRPWYVVVYGEYPTRKQATDAVATLPDALRKQRPWARSMKGIHNDINKK